MFPIFEKKRRFFESASLYEKTNAFLEVRTAVGFSAILMRISARRQPYITIENYEEKRIPIARENFKRAEKKNRLPYLRGSHGGPENCPDLMILFYGCKQKGNILHICGVIEF